MYWVNRLLNQCLNDIGESSPPKSPEKTISNLDFAQFSRIQNVKATTKDGITIFRYREEVFEDLCYIAMPPNVSRKQFCCQKFEMYFLVLKGLPKIVRDEKIFELKSGDMCLVKPGQNYSIHNQSSSPTLILLHRRKFVEA